MGKLKQESKLQLVEPSEEMCRSYLHKADNSLKSAKILLANNLFEDSISTSYYCMYNSLTALLFKNGIKCENHAASILLLKRLFSEMELFRIISKAKKQRIDKQYYVTSEPEDALTKEAASDMQKTAEDFLIKIRLFIGRQTSGDIERIRNSFESNI